MRVLRDVASACTRLLAPVKSLFGRPALAELTKICSVSVGLVGVQVVWGLQNLTTSRVFQTFGATMADLPILWIAGPITGLLVQPISGHFSDRSGRRMRRRLTFLGIGAMLTAIAMATFARANYLWAAVASLWLLTGSVNLTMQPLRALLADALPADRRAAGFSVQVVFIAAGAVFASLLPWFLGHWLHVKSTAAAGQLPPTIKTAFDIGAAVLVFTVVVTIVATRLLVPRRELPPISAISPAVSSTARPARAGLLGSGMAWILLATGIVALAELMSIRREVFLLAAIVALYGVGELMLGWRLKRALPVTGLLDIVQNIGAMPRLMRRLAVVQFATWFGLFGLWVYAVPAIAMKDYHAIRVDDPAYTMAADRVGIMLAISDGVSGLAALALPFVISRFGIRRSYCACLMLGACGLLGVGFIRSPAILWVSAVGLGCAWASILSIPYAIVSNTVAQEKVGEYLGIHNVFIVLPQLVAACILGFLLDKVFRGQAPAMLGLSAVMLALAGLLAVRLED